MSTPKRSRVFNRRQSFRQIRQLPKRFMAWLLRLVFVSARFGRTRQAGFVLPTTVMLILVLALTVGGLSFRSFSRVEQTIAYREQQRVDSFAAPAIDRAKSKIEYLFTKDRDIIDKRPPSSTDLVNAILAKSTGTQWKNANHAGEDPYTLPDETQLDINGDGDADPAWSFVSDGNTVVYSLLTSHEGRDSSGNLIKDKDGEDLTLLSNDTEKKADKLVTRNGPINTQRSVAGCPVSIFAGDGWQDAGGNLQKNFQIDILSISDPDGPNRTVSSAEYQQVRSSPKGNKYGAWFRYDMEIFPGEDFRWNGAMHSESNLITKQGLEAYLVSSPESCIFSPDASEITLSESSYDTNGDGTVDEVFQGHLISGASKNDKFEGTTVFHEENTVNPKNPGKDNLAKTTDSVVEGSAKLTDVAVDPVLIFTEDRTVNLQAPGGGSWQPEAAKQGADAKLLTSSSRVRVFPDAARPFVDDGFRADNRYGPKPVYDSDNSLKEKDGVLFSALGEADKKIGDPIVNHGALATDNPATQEYGLDGYWERRSIAQGLRAVVGQRLELGNQFEWTADDPLYPPTKVANLLDKSSNVEKGAAQAKQQKSLRDNLSAVQGMVVYHYSQDSGQTPYICMASAVHPGTEQTLIDSRTFDNYLPSSTRKRIDFFNGKGTNGWEFDFSTFDSDADGSIEDEFTNAMPMGKALRNLAYFAGDPAGGAPSFSPVQGEGGNAATEFVHPYPYLSMWGDFSVLRRIFAEYMDAGMPIAYTGLSPADRSTIDSTACTLGMLARNIEDLKAEYEAILKDGTTINALAGELTALVPGTITAATASATPAEDWIAELEAASSTYLEQAKIIALYRQVERDRRLGFKLGATGSTAYAAAGNYAADTYNFTCDPETEFPATATVDRAAVPLQQDRMSLGFAFCSESQVIKYPSLYYVLPAFDHEHRGDNGATGTAGFATFDNQQPLTEEYISEKTDSTSTAAAYISDGSTKINDALVYKAVDVSQIALTAAAAITDFKQPYATGTALASRDDLQKNTILVAGTAYDLTFLDKAMMDGRELANVRVLDLDIDKLTKIDSTGTDTRTFFNVGGDKIAWIPELDGVFYAAREDAVREDNIVRPRQSGVTWATCKVFANLIDNAKKCPMKVDFDAATPKTANQFGTYDPPLADNLISPKPVDMYADPDRRPYGFRLINGSVIHRSADDKAAGITFVTDNPAYIYGNFNLHQDSAGKILEEFTEQLGDAFAKGTGDPFRTFYDRKTLDTNFARGGLDLWRPSEVFADAVTILSDSFRDGWIDDAYRYRTDTKVDIAEDGFVSSYLNSDRPSIGSTTPKAKKAWQREDLQLTPGATATTVGSEDLPIRFNRNGIAFKAENETDDTKSYLEFPLNFGGDHILFSESDDRQKNQVPATDNTRVNALLVAGIVPLRSGQNYGGLHNFPRLIEYWKTKNLFVSGGFFQLNFSTHSTAPFDQDAWEPGATPDSSKVFNIFYGAATRIWGYDVAFQYTSVSPIARRFVTFGRPRSEFYRELALDDEYVANLCTAKDGADNLVLGANAGCQ